MRSTVAVMAAAVSLTVNAAADELDLLLDIAGEEFAPVDRVLERAPFYHGKRLTITENSLADGWVKNFQCHRHFSVAASLDVVFPAGKIRAVEVTQSEGIGNVQVVDHGLQLQDVREDSRLCFQSELRVLAAKAEDVYRLRLGPFFYRFLDGYFPTEVELTVRYPPSVLTVLQVSPDDSRGVRVVHDDGRLSVSSLFEGKLWVDILFKRRE